MEYTNLFEERKSKQANKKCEIGKKPNIIGFLLET